MNLKRRLHKLGCPLEQLEELDERFIIDYGFGKTGIAYGAKCKVCHKVQLVPSRGPERWYASDAISKEEAMDILIKKYKG